MSLSFEILEILHIVLSGVEGDCGLITYPLSLYSIFSFSLFFINLLKISIFLTILYKSYKYRDAKFIKSFETYLLSGRWWFGGWEETWIEILVGSLTAFKFCWVGWAIWFWEIEEILDLLEPFFIFSNSSTEWLKILYLYS